jgi:hypothetical protein
MKAAIWVLGSVVVAAALVTVGFALGQTTRTEKQGAETNDAAVARVYAAAVASQAKRQDQPIDIAISSVRYVGRDVWLVRGKETAPKVRQYCIALKIDEFKFRYNSPSGVAAVDCSWLPRHG